MIELTLADIDTLAASILMYTGVPFCRVCKEEVSAEAELLLDHATAILVDCSNQLGGSPSNVSAQVLLSTKMVELIAKLLELCLRECDGDVIYLRLHLRSDNEEKCRQLLAKLTQSL